MFTKCGKIFISHFPFGFKYIKCGKINSNIKIRTLLLNVQTFLWKSYQTCSILLKKKDQLRTFCNAIPWRRRPMTIATLGPHLLHRILNSTFRSPVAWTYFVFGTFCLFKRVDLKKKCELVKYAHRYLAPKFIVDKRYVWRGNAENHFGNM